MKLFLEERFLLLISLILCVNLVGNIDYPKGLRKLTENDYQKINELPEFEISKVLRGSEIPYKIDNSKNIYFRPIFNQTGGCCSHASAIAYAFTYEINSKRNISSQLPENQYPTHYTWNFVNMGNESGTWPLDALFIARDNGIPNLVDYGGSLCYGGPNRWMNSYYKYRKSMNNRISQIYKINLTNELGLNKLKRWFFDHGRGDNVGGLACFVANSTNMKVGIVPALSHQSGKKIVFHWGITDTETIADHAMTFVGYNDSICYDYNEDGKFTNNIDINGDGKIDMQDWERGALIIANSWSSNWGNSGFMYMPYKLLAESIFNGGIGERGNVYVMDVHEYYKPKLTYQIKMRHNFRHLIKINAGIAKDTSSTRPDYVLTFPLFNNQGGAHGMQGSNSISGEFLEFGIDVSPLLSYIDQDEDYRFFLEVIEKDPKSQGKGQIVSFAINDYRNELETFYSLKENIPIIDNDTTYVSIIKRQKEHQLKIITQSLPSFSGDSSFVFKLKSYGGILPHNWSLDMPYSADIKDMAYPDLSSSQKLDMPGINHAFLNKKLKFSFPFYNKNYNNIVISSDGCIFFNEDFYFGDTANKLLSQECMITPYFAEFVFDKEDASVSVLETDSSFCVEWRGHLQKTFEPVKAACEIFSSGIIKFYYDNDLDIPNGWIGGVSNGDGNNFYVVEGTGNSHVLANKSAIIKPQFNQNIFKMVNLKSNGEIRVNSQTDLESSVSVQVRDGAQVKRKCQYQLVIQDQIEPFIVLDSLYSDSGVVVIGETNNISLVLQNIGKKDAHDVSLNLLTDANLAIPLNPDSICGLEIPANSKLILKNAFQIIPSPSSQNLINFQTIAYHEKDIFKGSSILPLNNVHLKVMADFDQEGVNDPHKMKLNFKMANLSNFSTDTLLVKFVNFSNQDIDLDPYQLIIPSISSKDTIDLFTSCDISDILTNQEMNIGVRIYLKDMVFLEEYIFPVVARHIITKESFENGHPSAWNFINNEEDSLKWNLGSLYQNVEANFGNNYLYLDCDKSHADNWIILPKLNNKYDLKLILYARSKEFYAKSNFIIKLAEGSLELDNFKDISSLERPSSLWKKYEYYIESSKTEKYIALYTSSKIGSILYLDNISLEYIQNNIHDNEDNTINNTELIQNYPNPFNPITTISFTLSSSNLINLRVYNIRGEQLSCLVKNKTLNRGLHKYQFDGSHLASGIYYYQLQVGSDILPPKKMMFLK